MNKMQKQKVCGAQKKFFSGEKPGVERSGISANLVNWRREGAI
jgi:hypothetical protein